MPQVSPNFEDAKGYERLMGSASRAAGSVFLEWLDPPAGARWLDVGCGTGAFTGLIIDRCSPRSVHAIDPSKPQIEHARRQLSGMRVDLRVADAQALPFKDAAFDLAACALTINFVPDRTRALSEMCRVVRPGGFVAVTYGISRKNVLPVGLCELVSAASELICRKSPALDLPTVMRSHRCSRGPASKTCLRRASR
jgi:ubiquinone/menaquinone biosynthesis C-methylase UbiE